MYLFYGKVETYYTPISPTEYLSPFLFYISHFHSPFKDNNILSGVGLSERTTKRIFSRGLCVCVWMYRSTPWSAMCDRIISAIKKHFAANRRSQDNSYSEQIHTP